MPSPEFSRSSASVVLLVFLCFGSASGCGDSGPKRHGLSGKATFQGKPIPHGRVIFEPDGAKQNAGPQGFADIENGQFDTAAEGGQGHIGGAHVIRIEGFEGKPTATELAKPLFKPYQLNADLPQETSTKDIDVPASAAKDVQTDMGPPP